MSEAPALKQWLYGALTPALAFVSLFAAFYAMLFATSRADWLPIVVVACATIVATITAFRVRKVRPNAALALVVVPGLLLAAVLALH